MRIRPRLVRLAPGLAAVGFAVLGLAEIALDPPGDQLLAAMIAGCAVAVAGAIVAIWAPIVGSIVVSAMFPVTTALGLTGPTGVGVLAFFLMPGWAAYRRPPQRSWIAPVAAQILASLGVLIARLSPGATGVPFNIVWENLFFSCLVWASWGVGLMARRWNERAEQLARLAAALDAEREAAQRTAVVQERQRIAREVHDAVAHSVSVMTLQVGAVRLTLPPDAPQAEMLAGIERLGRESVQELRSLVGILRETPEGSPAPQPSLANADELIAEVRAAGLPVSLREVGTRPELPRALDVSAYRILQEALTNVLRHAGPVSTDVTLTYDRDGLAIDVADHGKGTSARQPIDGVGGHGLLGMRERVAMFGGTLAAGAAETGGFTVHAYFPLGEGR
ncbi:sensor histidine kinase [Microlunatus ginsengisoli]|uniref:sensor histidine kinase n=1 Tax=Microlunatus ginsengisoli TaxID=363863 RepID=UPI0031E0B94E